jgi:hypothetical protein
MSGAASQNSRPTPGPAEWEISEQDALDIFTCFLATSRARQKRIAFKASQP